MQVLTDQDNSFKTLGVFGALCRQLMGYDEDLDRDSPRPKIVDNVKWQQGT